MSRLMVRSAFHLELQHNLPLAVSLVLASHIGTNIHADDIHPLGLLDLEVKPNMQTNHRSPPLPRLWNDPDREMWFR